MLFFFDRKESLKRYSDKLKLILLMFTYHFMQISVGSRGMLVSGLSCSAGLDKI